MTKEYLDFKLKELRFDMDLKFNSMTLKLGVFITAILTFFKVMDHFWH